MVDIGIDQIDLYLGFPGPEQLQVLGRCVTQIEDAISDEGPAVVDPNHGRPAAADVGDAHGCAKRKGGVGSGHLEHVVDLAVCGELPVEGVAIPTSRPNLERLDRRWRMLGAGHEPAANQQYDSSKAVPHRESQSLMKEVDSIF
jgi:hypothetical protein